MQAHYLIKDRQRFLLKFVLILGATLLFCSEGNAKGVIKYGEPICDELEKIEKNGTYRESMKILIDNIHVNCNRAAKAGITGSGLENPNNVLPAYKMLKMSPAEKIITLLSDKMIHGDPTDDYLEVGIYFLFETIGPKTALEIVKKTRIWPTIKEPEKQSKKWMQYTPDKTWASISEIIKSKVSNNEWLNVDAETEKEPLTPPQPIAKQQLEPEKSKMKPEPKKIEPATEQSGDSSVIVYLAIGFIVLLVGGVAFVGWRASRKKRA